MFVFEHPIGTQSEFRAVLIGSYHSNNILITHQALISIFW